MQTHACRQESGVAMQRAFGEWPQYSAVSVVVHLCAHGFARAENVVFNYWWMNSAWLSKEISTQQCLNAIDHQEAIFPTMRNVRSINPAHRVLAKGQDLVICQ